MTAREQLSLEERGERELGPVNQALALTRQAVEVLRAAGIPEATRDLADAIRRLEYHRAWCVSVTAPARPR